VRRRGGPSFTPYIYSEAELKRILAGVPAATSTRSGIDADTLRTFVLLLYGAGLRRGEARGLKVEDVDLPRSPLHIKETKFFKTRIVPISTQPEHGIEGIRREVPQPAFDTRRRPAVQPKGRHAPKRFCSYRSIPSLA
jgi:integrase/recombinase XerD